MAMKKYQVDVELKDIPAVQTIICAYDDDGASANDALMEIYKKWNAEEVVGISIRRID
jgi:hypothetical protein